MLSKFFGKTTNFPKWIERYLSEDFKPDLSASIWSPPYVVLDCETTGITRKDQIVSIGAVVVKGKSIALSEVLDIKVPVKQNAAAAAVHGELTAELDPLNMPMILQDLLTYLSQRIIVGHHISFDIGKLNQLYQKHVPGFKLKNHVLDTMTLMKRIDPVRYERNVAGADSMQLDALCKEFGILVENRHTALGDAYLTAQLFQKLLIKLEGRGITRMSDLMRTPGGF